MAARGFVTVAFLSLLFGATIPAPGDTIFSSHGVMTLRLEGPFNELFTRVAQNQKTIDPNSAVTGKLTVTEHGHDTEIDGVKIAVRGHTNRRQGECPFPK